MLCNGGGGLVFAGQNRKHQERRGWRQTAGANEVGKGSRLAGKVINKVVECGKKWEKKPTFESNSAPSEMVNLIGVYECKLDAKGRAPLPAALKKQLAALTEGGFVLKRSVFSKCLELYPLEEWNAVMGQVGQLNRFVKKHADFIRMFTAGVKPVELDNAGRILIPKDLMAFAGLGETLVFASAPFGLEIWDKEAYENVVQASEADFGALAEEVMGQSNERPNHVS
jgi:MraZ protein